MYETLTFLLGAVLAVMIMVNGGLSAQYGVFTAAAIIHAVGSLSAWIACAFQKDKKALWGHQPVWIYLGGAVGVLTTLFNNFAYEKISTTSIVALGLFGQFLTSAWIDGFGLFGMERRPIRGKSPRGRLAGCLFALAGIFAMLDSTVASSVWAIGLSVCAGAAVVVSRTINARLARRVGPLRGSLINHLVGLPITAVLAAISIIGSGFVVRADDAFTPWIYCGGMLGVVTVLLNNITVPRVPAFRLTALSFVGQVLTGILLDVLMGNSRSDTTLAGGILVAIGIAIDIVTQWQAERREQREKAYWDRIKQAEQEHRQLIMEKYASR